ncbi:cytochrome b [Pelagovum pacificum]|uniref:Cytochrome b n=1 Tax=Pelagovum pacificum TaxID=2588711 RepID=A0A5C5GJ53_9RHOB|nr:cytochrome b [Pelagovum pacificum]QQA42692.1 cytochrome b [Pelagovum pacificum]TNY34157.1 cytochrome b [Pelagovum pacificum]
MSDRMRSYRGPAKALHWIVALLVVSTIPAGLVMVQDGIGRGLQDALFIYHKHVGVLILILVLVRLAYRLANPPPPLPDSVPPLQQRVAVATHWLLYAALLVMALSGYVRVVAGDFPIEFLDRLGVPPLVPANEALAETAKSIHAITRFALIPLVLMHIGAALFHAVVLKDGVFASMWPGRGASS